MKETKLHIYVEGHTDSRPIHTARYPSNWELSVARAVNVVEHMMKKYSIAPERMGVAGYGDSMLVAPDINEKNRRKNRRIEIILKYKAPAYVKRIFKKKSPGFFIYKKFDFRIY